MLGPAFFALVATSAGAAWPSLSQPASTPGGGAGDAAVVVAIEDYGSVPDVPGAQRNGDDWYQHLTAARRIPAERVWLLKNNEGTLERMRKYLRLAADAVQKGGTLWFVFIGHGAPAPDGKDGLLVGFDAQADVESLTSRSLSRSELLTLAVNGKAGRSVLVLDACFSGRTFAGKALVPGFQPLLALQAPAKPPARALIFTAAQADQFAGPLPGAGRPAFSYLLLGALRGWGDADHDGEVTATEAWQFARTGLQTVVRDRSQFPELDGVDDGTPLATQSRERAPDLAALATLRAEPAGEPPPAVGGPAAVGAGYTTSQVELLNEELGTPYQVTFVSGRREEVPCRKAVDADAPCTLSLPVGPGRFELKGEHEATVPFMVTQEYATVALAPRRPGMLVGGVIATLIGGVGLLASINELATNGGRSQWGAVVLGLSITPLLLGILSDVAWATSPSIDLEPRPVSGPTTKR